MNNQNQIETGENVVSNESGSESDNKQIYSPPTIDVFVAEEVIEGGGPNVYESQEGGGYFS